MFLLGYFLQLWGEGVDEDSTIYLDAFIFWFNHKKNLFFIFPLFSESFVFSFLFGKEILPFFHFSSQADYMFIIVFFIFDQI